MRYNYSNAKPVKLTKTTCSSIKMEYPENLFILYKNKIRVFCKSSLRTWPIIARIGKRRERLYFSSRCISYERSKFSKIMEASRNIYPYLYFYFVKINLWLGIRIFRKWQLSYLSSTEENQSYEKVNVRIRTKIFSNPHTKLNIKCSCTKYYATWSCITIALISPKAFAFFGTKKATLSQMFIYPHKPVSIL